MTLMNYITGSKGSTETWFNKTTGRYIVYAHVGRDGNRRSYTIDCDDSNRHDISDLICGWGELPANAELVAIYT